METNNTTKTLVVLLHGYATPTSKYRTLKEKVEEIIPGARVIIPRMPLALFSCANPNTIVDNLIATIDEEWQTLTSGNQEARIILMGHSTGAIIARKLYIVACGENAEAPFEKVLQNRTPKAWAKNIDRLILFAGINKGWQLTPHMPLALTLFLNLLILTGKVMTAIGLKPVAFQTKKGHPFVTQLRIQALAMFKHAQEKGVGNALTIQLLGTKDPLVSPEDNIDLLTGHQFIYLEMPSSDHLSVINMSGPIGLLREAVLSKALTEDRQQLKNIEIIPSDDYMVTPNVEVTDVVFVIHGIRDTGYWTQKIARRVKSRGDKLPGRKFATETSTYGYFPMLSFLLYPIRQQKVNWFMEQYIENLSLYPNASFSFIGHSNGTYLLAKALKDYDSVKFKNVVLAGSVVPKSYDWEKYTGIRKIQCIYNLVANNDWVVAIFPRSLQRLRIQDLGSGGYDGFRCLTSNQEVKYLAGGHGAGVEETVWDELSHIVIHGQPANQTTLAIQPRSFQMKVIAFLGPLLFFGAICLLGWLGIRIFEFSDEEPRRFILTALYMFLVWKILTKF